MAVWGVVIGVGVRMGEWVEGKERWINWVRHCGQCFGHDRQVRRELCHGLCEYDVGGYRLPGRRR